MSKMEKIEQPAEKAPLSEHPAFGPLMIGWGAAIFGLATHVVSMAVSGSLVLALILAFLATGAGAFFGAQIARGAGASVPGFAFKMPGRGKSKRKAEKKPVMSTKELGSESLDAPLDHDSEYDDQGVESEEGEELDADLAKLALDKANHEGPYARGRHFGRSDAPRAEQAASLDQGMDAPFPQDAEPVQHADDGWEEQAPEPEPAPQTPPAPINKLTEGTVRWPGDERIEEAADEPQEAPVPPMPAAMHDEAAAEPDEVVPQLRRNRLPGQEVAEPKSVFEPEVDPAHDEELQANLRSLRGKGPKVAEPTKQAPQAPLVKKQAPKAPKPTPQEPQAPLAKKQAPKAAEPITQAPKAPQPKKRPQKAPRPTAPQPKQRVAEPSEDFSASYRADMAKLRSNNLDRLSMIQMIDRFAGALEDHRSARALDPSSRSACPADADIIDAIRQLPASARNAATTPSKREQAEETEDALRVALQKLQRMSGNG